MLQQGGSNRSRGLSPLPLTLTTARPNGDSSRTHSQQFKHCKKKETKCVGGRAERAAFSRNIVVVEAVVVAGDASVAGVSH